MSVFPIHLFCGHICDMIPVDASAPNTQLVPAFLKAEVLSEALPYIQRFHGKTIVIKYGGCRRLLPGTWFF